MFLLMPRCCNCRRLRRTCHHHRRRRLVIVVVVVVAAWNASSERFDCLSMLMLRTVVTKVAVSEDVVSFADVVKAIVVAVVAVVVVVTAIKK